MKSASIGMIVAIVIVSVSLFAGCNDGNRPLALVKFQLPDSGYLTITCEIAESPNDRAKGLIGRKELAEGKGMLFVYATQDNRSFWMKDTLIPLDIIFIDGNGTVINVEETDVEPGVPDDKLTSYHSLHPAKWVLEINRGICARYGIDRGTRVVIESLHSS